MVAVQELPALAAIGEHEATSVGPVLLLEQVRVTQLFPAAAVCGVHDATGTFVVTTGAGQVVVVQLLPELATAAVQVPTG